MARYSRRILTKVGKQQKIWQKNSSHTHQTFVGCKESMVYIQKPATFPKRSSVIMHNIEHILFEKDVQKHAKQNIHYYSNVYLQNIA
jgi:hypothetical protein